MATDPEIVRSPHGLRWGNAEVTCLASYRGHRWLEIETPRQTMEIRITPSGLIRTTIAKATAAPAAEREE